MRKKLLAVLLASTMIMQPLSAIGATEFEDGIQSEEVFEFGDEESLDVGQEFEAEPEAETTGAEVKTGKPSEDAIQMGDDVWVEFKGNTAILSGTGKMWDYLEDGTSLENKNINPFFENYGIKNIIIGNNITSIGDYFVKGNYEIENVVFGESIKEIGAWSFSGCNLNSLELPNGLISIKELAFNGAGIKAKEIILPDSISYLGEGAFFGAGKIETIKLPNNLKDIPNVCFESCRYLKNVEFGDKISEIGSGAFNDCRNLKSITLPSSLRLMKDGVFRDCFSLETVIFSDGCQVSIPYASFYNCKRLKNILMPEGIENIGNSVDGWYTDEGAFENCSSLNEITIPKSIKNINNNTFKGCNNLTKIKGYICSGAKKYYDSLSDELKQKITFESIGEGHTWSEWVTSSKVTVFEPEYQKRICLDCNIVESRNIGVNLSPTIKVNTTSILLNVKQSTNKIVVSELSNGDYVKSWKSSNKKIVTVTNNGVITAKSKTGIATITVTLASGLQKEIKVTVQKGTVITKKITGVSKNVTLKKGKSTTLKPVLSPITSQEKVTYTSSNAKVATVNSKGKITAKSKGTAKITVKSGKKKVICTVVVK